jgi:hypothetical protein
MGQRLGHQLFSNPQCKCTARLYFRLIYLRNVEVLSMIQNVERAALSAGYETEQFNQISAQLNNYTQ